MTEKINSLETQLAAQHDLQQHVAMLQAHLAQQPALQQQVTSLQGQLAAQVAHNARLRPQEKARVIKTQDIYIEHLDKIQAATARALGIHLEDIWKTSCQ